MQGVGYVTNVRLVVAVELLRNGVWLVTLLGMLSKISEVRVADVVASRYGFVVAAVALLPFVAYVVRTSDEAPFLITVSLGYLLSVIALSVVEQIYRNATPDLRPSLNYFCVGIGGQFVFDLFAFVLAIVGEPIGSQYWSARGFVSVLVAAPLGVGIWRSFDLTFDTLFPRQIVFYTLGVSAIGVYVVLAAIGHYYVRTYAGGWGDVAGIVFIVAAFGMVLLVVVSPSTRARLRVFLTKTFFQYKYDYRKEWLRFISTLSESESEQMPQSAIRAVAQIVHSPGGVVWLEEQPEDGFTPAASLGCELPLSAPLSRDSDLVRFLEERQWVIDLSEMERFPARYGNLELNHEMMSDARWWLLVPLLMGSELSGFIMLLRPRVVHSLNFEDHDLLKTVGRHVATFVNQAEVDRRLAESGQFGAYNRLTAFLMHDLNNLVAQQSLVVTNAERHRDNPKFVDDAIETIAHSVTRMKRLMTQLTSGKEPTGLQETDLVSIVNNAIARSAPRLPAVELSCDLDAYTVHADPERLTSAFEHLIRNAQDATEDDGNVNVTIQKDGDGVMIVVADDGAGMTPEFIRGRLFRPFDSTKGSQSMGIGAYQAREYVRMIGGQLAVASELGVGTTFTLRLPAGGA